MIASLHLAALCGHPSATGRPDSKQPALQTDATVLGIHGTNPKHPRT
jgi:hypothetical protein